MMNKVVVGRFRTLAHEPEYPLQLLSLAVFRAFSQEFIEQRNGFTFFIRWEDLMCQGEFLL